MADLRAAHVDIYIYIYIYIYIIYIYNLDILLRRSLRSQFLCRASVARLVASAAIKIAAAKSIDHKLKATRNTTWKRADSIA